MLGGFAGNSLFALSQLNQKKAVHARNNFPRMLWIFLNMKFSPKAIPVSRSVQPFRLFLRGFSCVPHEIDCQFLEKLRCSFRQFGLYPYLRNLNPKEELRREDNSFPIERLCILNSKCSFVFLLKMLLRVDLLGGNPVLN